MPGQSSFDLFNESWIIRRISTISEFEEDRYSDIPKWSGQYVTTTQYALLLRLDDGRDVWVPFTQLRKAEDENSLYASNWILNERGL